MKEEWKVLDFSPEYQVSNTGRIKKNGKLKYPSANNGYLRIGILINGKYKTFGVHRLVAEAFIPNPENKPEVNHIDCNKYNNNVSNLEWTTKRENIEHAIKNNLFSKANKPVKDKKQIAGEKLKRFCQSRGLRQKDVASILGISLGSVQAYYLGLRTPQDATKLLMKEKLGLDIYDIFYNTDL